MLFSIYKLLLYTIHLFKLFRLSFLFLRCMPPLVMGDRICEMVGDFSTPEGL